MNLNPDNEFLFRLNFIARFQQDSNMMLGWMTYFLFLVSLKEDAHEACLAFQKKGVGVTNILRQML